MVSTFTPNKLIEKPAHNDYIDSWDIPVNADWSIIDLAFGGSVTVNLTGLSGNQVLTSAQYQPLKIIASGAPIGAVNLVVPSGVGGLWVVRNNTTGGQIIAISSAAGGSLITVPANTNTVVTCDGTATGMFLAVNTAPVAGGLDTQVQFNDAGILGGSAGLVWDKVNSILSVSNLTVLDNTILGNAAGDTLTIGGTAVSALNGLNFNSNQLVLSAPPAVQVGIGTATLGSEALTVAGVIHSTAGGIMFPDGSVQTTAFAATGLMLDYLGSTAPTGWVFANGTTIGNVASNATGLANDTTTLALFTLLWNAWANSEAPVFDSAGVATLRGVSAAADFGANKAIRVPDLRGRVSAGLDTMGNPAGGAGRLTSVIMSPNGNTLGGSGGIQTQGLTHNELPNGLATFQPIGPSFYQFNNAAAVYLGYQTDPPVATTRTQPTLLLNKIIKL